MSTGGGGSLMKAIIDSAESIIGPKVSNDIEMKRRKICSGCELFKSHRLGSTCGEFSLNISGRDQVKEGCGCVLEVKWKGPNNNCPRGLW